VSVLINREKDSIKIKQNIDVRKASLDKVEAMIQLVNYIEFDRQACSLDSWCVCLQLDVSDHTYLV
jgi:hypothetical protein